jgi:hypothetical protein
MANPRRRAINKKPENNWRETSAAALKQTRETLGAQIQEKMSEYTNRHLWKNARTATPAVVDNSDPQDIKDCSYFSTLKIRYDSEEIFFGCLYLAFITVSPICHR